MQDDQIQNPLFLKHSWRSADCIPGALHDTFEGIVALGAPGCSSRDSEAIWLRDSMFTYVHGH